MKQNDNVDKALCDLNSQILELKRSSEYQTGVKIRKFIYSIKHINLKPLRIALEHRRIEKKLKKDHKTNLNFLTFDDSITTSSRIAVYTCITGNYDLPLEPIYVPNNVDFYIVTDLEISHDSMWKKIDITSIESIQKYDNTRKARYVKTHPHVFFHDYEYSIWIDSNIRAVGDLSKFIKCIGKTVPFASNWHPVRNSIYTELNACIARKKDDPEMLIKQINHYKKLGMPEDFGLIETNMLVRKHSDPKCIKLMEDWWEEIDKWSKRDQLSLPFVIWKNGYSMHDLGFIGTEIRCNPSLQVVLHDSTYRCPVK